MAKGLIIWSTEEEHWVINPCLCCVYSMQRFSELYCSEHKSIVYKDDFCSLWTRKETRDEDN